MKRIQLLLVISITVYAADPPGGYYQSKYDSLDVENVLNNKRLVNYYANCLLSRGPCPPQGADLKRILSEALETNCLRCTKKQKEVAVTSLKRLRSEYPIVWSELVSVYDPNGQYFIEFIKTLDPTIEIEDQTNLLSNRFGDDDFPNNLEAVTTTMTKKPTKRVTKSSTRRPTTRPAESISTKTEGPLLNMFTTASSKNGSTNATNVTTDTRSAIPENQPPVMFGWRPTVFSLGVSRPPSPLAQSNANLLTSIGQIGSKVIQAGTQVAEMVLSSVQALVGNN